MKEKKLELRSPPILTKYVILLFIRAAIVLILVYY